MPLRQRHVLGSQRHEHRRGGAPPRRCHQPQPLQNDALPPHAHAQPNRCLSHALQIIGLMQFRNVLKRKNVLKGHLLSEIPIQPSLGFCCTILEFWVCDIRFQHGVLCSPRSGAGCMRGGRCMASTAARERPWYVKPHSTIRPYSTKCLKTVFRLHLCEPDFKLRQTKPCIEGTYLSGHL
jgi:hypothetical protein